ncbi:MAG: 3'(2'),5'-bisphosphate nucleotidase CysQ [Campylobacterota bacterium]|nr:3'(2'),5'-bisphosphate nucleotidase CysQ [Campylobacterota bacterium]
MLNNINIEDVKNIAKEAGKVIMEIYKKDFQVEYKDDKSPLTQADLRANKIICSSLEKLYPNIPIISEENKQTDYDIRKNWEYYWCIDPIDGTKEFIKKNDEFTVNIALIYKDTPVLGVVYAPAIEKMYWAKKDEGAYLEKVSSEKYVVSSRKKLPLTKNSDDDFTVVASKSHLSQETQKFIDDLTTSYPLLTTNSKGSSLKLCMVATGEADIYPRIAPTMEWDTAAADAIVRESGKMTYQYNPERSAKDYLSTNDQRLTAISYNKENLLNPYFVVV